MKPKSTLRPFLLAAGSSLLAVSSASAATWDGPNNGDYATAVNWNPDGVPVSGDTNIASAGGITAIYSTAGNITSSGRLLIGSTGANTGTLTMQGSAGTLSFAGSPFNAANYIGVDGSTGTINVNAGTLALTGMTNGAGHLHIGANGSVSNGTLNIGGGTVNVGTRVTMGVGYPGSDAINTVGNNGNGNATLTISSGSLNIGSSTVTDTDKGGLYMKSPTGGSGTATVNLNGGTLNLTRFIPGAGGTSKAVNFNGGTLMARASVANFLPAATGFTANVNNGGAVIDTQAFNVTVGAALVASGTGGLTKSGTGTLTLSGVNTYTGATTLTAGTLSVGASNNLGASAANLVFDGGTLQITGTALTNFSTIGHTVSFNATKAVGLDISSAGHTFTVDQVLNQTTGGFTKAGAGSVILNQANTYTGVTTLSAGTLSVATIGDGGVAGNLGQATNAAANLVFDGGTLDYTGANATSNRAFTIIAGKTATINTANNLSLAGATGAATTGALTKTGAGRLTLTGASTYTGLTTVSGGTLEFSGVGTISASSGINVQNGGTLQFSRNDTWGNHNTGATSAITIDAGGVVQSNNTFNALINLTLNGGTLSANDGVNATFPTFGLKGTVTVNATAGGSTISTTGTGDNNTVSIGTGVSGGITTFAVANGAAASDLTVSVPLSNLAGVSSALSKTGVGTMTITSTSTYTGATTVSNGTLLINGNISTSNTTVASGATIGGSGTVGALTIANGGTIAPGNSPGFLNTGDYIQAGLYTAEIDGLTAGTQHDQIRVTGTVNITGGTLATLFGAGTYVNDNMIFLLLNDGTEAIVGNYTGFAEGSVFTTAGTRDWLISYTANSTTGLFTGGNDIALMAVPEPSAALLGGLGMLALLRRRR